MDNLSSEDALRIAIKTNPQNTTWDQMLATWQRADAIPAIESAWVFDHFYPIMSDPHGPCLEGWTSMSALANATSRIQVGIMVTGMPYRHPAVTANMAATVDIISEGRLQLGLGAGWHEVEANAYGISLGETVGDRMDMFDEGVEIIASLLSQEWTDFQGKHFTLEQARCEPKGPQSPRPPIVIGGGGEKRTLRTAAKFADHWNATPMDVEIWRHKRSVLDRHCDDVGRDPADIMSSTMLRFDPSGDPGAMRDRMETFAAAGIDLFVVNMPAPHDPGHVEQLADTVEPLLD